MIIPQINKQTSLRHDAEDKQTMPDKQTHRTNIGLDIEDRPERILQRAFELQYK